MTDKQKVGIRRGSFIKLMETQVGITDFETLNKIYDKMLIERKSMDELLTHILVNYVKNNPGIHGDYREDDIDHLISEFENIIQDLKIKKNKIIKR